MAREKKPRGSDAKLARLLAMRNQPATPETTPELRRYLADASSLIVAEAARIIKDHAVPEQIGDLVAAFHRLMINPEESDKQCRAKIEIVDALNRLEYAEPDVFLRGLIHRQDPRFGESGQDAAGALRAFCAFGLARIGHPGVVLLLTELLLDSDDTTRAGAARALGFSGSLAAVPLLRYKVRTGDRLTDVIGECFASLLTLSFEESLPFVAHYLRGQASALQATAVFAMAETRRPEAFAFLSDYWSVAPADLRESLLVALAMFRLPAANDFLISLIAGKDESARAALSALAIHRNNPKITASIAIAVEANGEESVREWFRKKFPAEPEEKEKNRGRNSIQVE
ncbi:MAG: HEAT repeat domain-containing protein [Planctomycetes bacterium]|nr:HEAT repeat domain-containing protein [Planctomycetota bacterium]